MFSSASFEGVGDYETNKKKHGGVALIGLIWCTIWIWILSDGLKY